VFETDLGERIQQLDDQTPNHIVGPSIHKTIKDVANLFAKKYGSDPNNEDAAGIPH
jgi:L-lactate dehydrogenase complex protein LldF